MLMHAAFEEIAGREMVMDESPAAEADRLLWNAAWDYAREQYLTLKEKA